MTTGTNIDDMNQAADLGDADLFEVMQYGKNLQMTGAQVKSAMHRVLRGVYYGVMTADPVLDPNGDAVLLGDHYYNSTTDRMRVFRAAGWTDYEAAAVAARDAAETAQGKAELARDAAVLARDAAQLSAVVYASTAAGISATIDGQYFNVPVSSANDALILYKNNAGAPQEIVRYPSADGVVRKVYQPLNHDSKLPNGWPDYLFINSPAPQYIVNCTIDKIRKSFGICNWLHIPANVDLFGDAVNGCFLAAKTPTGTGLSAGTWVQQAFVMYSPSGQFGMYDDSMLMWDPIAAILAPLQYKQIDAETRIYWSQYMITNQASTTLMSGGKYGIKSYDRYIGNWVLGLFDFEPADLMLDLVETSLHGDVAKLARMIGGAVMPANDDWALIGGKPATGFINPAPAQYVVPCNVDYVRKRFGIDYWWEAAAGVGQTDGGAMNNVFLVYDHPDGQAIAAGTWIQQAYIVYSPSAEFPTPGGVLMFKPVAFVPNVVTDYIPINQNLRIYFNTYQITDEAGTQTLIGNQHSQVYGYGFFIGGWSIATFKYKPIGLAINMEAETFAKRINILEKKVSETCAEETSNDLESLNAVFLGDSITSGAGSYDHAHSWADLLHAKVGFKSFTKLAVSGATVKPTWDSSNGGFWRYKLSDEVAEIPAGADLICVLIGVNDAGFGNSLGDLAAVMAKPYASLDQTASFAEAYRYNMETIKRNFPAARIVAMMPLQWGSAYPSDIVEPYRAIERVIAGWLSIPVIEMGKECGMWGGGPYFPDGLHPNDAGYQIMAGFMRRRLGAV